MLNKRTQAARGEKESMWTVHGGKLELPCRAAFMKSELLESNHCPRVNKLEG